MRRSKASISFQISLIYKIMHKLVCFVVNHLLNCSIGGLTFDGTKPSLKWLLNMDWSILTGSFSLIGRFISGQSSSIIRNDYLKGHFRVSLKVFDEKFRLLLATGHPRPEAVSDHRKLVGRLEICMDLYKKWETSWMIMHFAFEERDGSRPQPGREIRKNVRMVWR